MSHFEDNNMTKPTEIYENLHQESFLADANIDRDAGVLRNVTLLGTVSRNKRRYTENAMRDAVRLYEGASFYIDHPTKADAKDRDNVRSIKDLAGKVSNVRMVDNYVRGDITLLKDDSLASKVLNIAEQMPDKAGNSHRVMASTRNRRDAQGFEVVEGIDQVLGIEFVTDPATTKGVFESIDSDAVAGTQQELELGVDNMTYEEYKDSDHAKQLIAEHTNDAEQAVELDGLQKQVTEYREQVATLEAALDDYKVKEAIETKKAHIAEVIASSDLPKAAVTDTFVEQLMNADAEQVDAIIKDRHDLVKSTAVQKQPEKDWSSIVESVGNSTTKSSDVDLSAVASRLFI